MSIISNKHSFYCTEDVKWLLGGGARIYELSYLMMTVLIFYSFTFFIYLEASRASAVYDRRIDSPQMAVMQTRNASDMDALRKLGSASATSVRRKTLCDITNLRRPLAAEEGSR